MSNIKVGDTVEKISGDSFLGSSLTNTVEAVDGRKVLTKETATTVFIDKSKPSTKSCKLSWIDEFVQSSLLDRVEALKACNKRLDSLKAEVNNSSAPLATKNCNQYQHGSTLEMHSNKQEEKIMSEEVKTNTVVVEVSTEPYAETTVATFFGKVIDSKSESELIHVISVIDDKQEALKALNRNAKSRRIIGQINKLGAARTKVVAMLDSLPE